MTSRAYSAAGLERTRGGRIPSSQRFRGIDSKGRRCEQRIHPPPQLSRHCKPCALFPKPCQSDPGSHLTDRNHTFKKLLMHGRAPSGMGIFPKSETHCHNLSFFGRQDFQKRDFRKTRNCGSAFQILRNCPYLITLHRSQGAS